MPGERSRKLRRGEFCPVHHSAVCCGRFNQLTDDAEEARDEVLRLAELWYVGKRASGSTGDLYRAIGKFIKLRDLSYLE